jgi:hypothetical protein
MNKHTTWHLDHEIRPDLVEFYNSIEKKWVQQYAMGTRYRTQHVHKAFRHDLTESETESLRDLIHADGFKIGHAYALRYGPGSFARLHNDQPDAAHRTSVTLISQSDSIIGGEAIVTDFIGVPTIVKQKIGQTLWYPQNLVHGVGVVEKGERVVLIAWWKKV